MGKHRIKKIQQRHKKFEGLEEVIVPKRVCIGLRAGVDCEATFQPKSKWNFMCEQCNEYIARVGGD